MNKNIALAVWALLAVTASTVAVAQECVISGDQLVGLLGNDGKCQGFGKDFAQKYLRIEQSQCRPPPKKGNLFLGKCIADARPLQTTADGEDEIRKLTALIDLLRGEIGVLREKTASQYNELMSEIDYLKSVLESRRR